MSVITVVIAAVWPAALARTASLLLRVPDRFTRIWLWTAATGTALAPLQRDWLWAAGSAVSLAVALAVWWWRRKKRRNALALLGAKARAARDALVRKAREAAQPRPVLRPVPQAR